ncbi:MAG: PAS domain-containing sensor histidine kinase [Bacteroidota bacterium]
METNQSYEALNQEIADLKEQLDEAHDIIDAIRKGEVDAFVVKAEDKHELYTLKSADKTYRIFIERMIEGAVTLNTHNEILYCNSSFAEFIQVGLENIIGTPFMNFIPDKYQATVEQLIKTAWKKNESKGEIILHRNEKELPLVLSMNTIEIDFESALSIIITDLSLQKETQEQKKAMEQKDEFISIASHELKTPVTSIKGYVQLLRSNFQEEKNYLAVELLTKADTQLNKLANLINDLLDVKKMENGQLQYHEDVFDFNDLVKEIVDETGRIMPKHPIEVDFDTTCNIYGDRNKIGQVITNLIDNAGKYSPANTSIAVKSTLNEGIIKLSVKDKGMGIPEDQQGKIFERFFRVNRNNGNTYAGLGLGLYICSEIIRRHHGTINVESEAGDGSEFYFELPVHP